MDSPTLIVTNLYWLYEDEQQAWKSFLAELASRGLDPTSPTLPEQDASALRRWRAFIEHARISRSQNYATTI